VDRHRSAAAVAVEGADHAPCGFKIGAATTASHPPGWPIPQWPLAPARRSASLLDAAQHLSGSAASWLDGPAWPGLTGWGFHFRRCPAAGRGPNQPTRSTTAWAARDEVQAARDAVQHAQRGFCSQRSTASPSIPAAGQRQLAEAGIHAPRLPGGMVASDQTLDLHVGRLAALDADVRLPRVSTTGTESPARFPVAARAGSAAHRQLLLWLVSRTRARSGQRFRQRTLYRTGAKRCCPAAVITTRQDGPRVVASSPASALLGGPSATAAYATNQSKKLAVACRTGPELQPETSLETSVPVVLTLGSRNVRIQSSESADVQIQGLVEATIPPGSRGGWIPASASCRCRPPVWRGGGATAGCKPRWACCTASRAGLDFVARAAQAVVDLVAWIRPRPDCWTTRMEAPARQDRASRAVEPNWQPSRQVLSRVQQEKRTFWQAPAAIADGASLVGVKAVVAAPILNPQGSVIGAPHGDRRQQSDAGSTAADHQAGGHAGGAARERRGAGLARLERSRPFARANVQFEQSHARAARHLSTQPDWQNGRGHRGDRAVLRHPGFSRIGERLNRPG